MRINEIIIDNRNGIGAVPYNADIDYFGLRVKMRPSIFLSLARPLPDDTNDSVEKHISSGGSIGAPFLEISIPEAWDDNDFSKSAKVAGHEGRHRMSAIKKLEGDSPIEVHLIPRGGYRRRDLTDDIISNLNSGLINEAGNKLINGPLFTV